MATAERSWSRFEVEAIVADYFDMFVKDLRGIPFKKIEHNRQLQTILNGRTHGSIEFKHRNISAALLKLRRPYLSGYVPALNYQDLLLDVVDEQLRLNSELALLLHETVEEPSSPPSVDDILARLRPPPREKRKRSEYARERPRRPRTSVDYLLAEARNSALGREGELFVVRFEVARLISESQEGLASKVEHVSVTKGDHEGYDVLSFDADGRERLIEVKTTKFGEFMPFFVSRNQVDLSQRESAKFHLYRPYEFRKDPKLFWLQGALPETCRSTRRSTKR